MFYFTSPPKSLISFKYLVGQDYWGLLVNTPEQIYGRSVMKKIKAIEEILKIPKFTDITINFISTLGKKRFFRDALTKLFFAMVRDMADQGARGSVKKSLNQEDNDKTEEELEEGEDIKLPKSTAKSYNYKTSTPSHAKESIQGEFYEFPFQNTCVKEKPISLFHHHRTI